MNLVRLTVLLLVIGCSTAQAQERWSEVPVTDPSIREAIVVPVVGCRPPDRKGVEHHITKEGQYALYGDLFGHGRNFAFTQFDKGTGFCEWKNHRWEAKQAWDIPVEWNSPITAEDRLGGAKAAEEGFATLQCGPNRHLVLISSEVGKYHQDFYIVQYNDAKDVPEVVGETMNRPSLKAGYLVAYNCSPRLSEWESWDFYRIHASQLIHAAHWSEYQSVNNPDEHSTTIRTYKEDGQVIDELNLRDPDGESNGRGYTITHTRKGATNSSVEFDWRKVQNLDPSTFALESRYLFTKLTGLPVELYPTEQSEKFTYTLKNLTAVRVTGDANDIARLSTSTNKRTN